jgi:hypothetical protein
MAGFGPMSGRVSPIRGAERYPWRDGSLPRLESGPVKTEKERNVCYLACFPVVVVR